MQTKKLPGKNASASLQKTASSPPSGCSRRAPLRAVDTNGEVAVINLGCSQVSQRQQSQRRDTQHNSDALGKILPSSTDPRNHTQSRGTDAVSPWNVCTRDGSAVEASAENPSTVDGRELGFQRRQNPDKIQYSVLQSSKLLGSHSVLHSYQHYGENAVSNNPPLPPNKRKRRNLSLWLWVVLGVYSKSNTGGFQSVIPGTGPCSSSGPGKKGQVPPPDIHQPFGEWISLDPKMALTNIEGWESLCQAYLADVGLYLYPLAREVREEPYVLLRGRGKHGRLFIASMQESDIYHLGDGDYFEQFMNLRRLDFMMDEKYYLLRGCLERMYPRFVCQLGLG
jgi:hypothetical protein